MFEYGLAMLLCAISGALMVVIVSLWTRSGIAIKAILFGLGALLLTGAFAITWPPFIEGKMSILSKTVSTSLSARPRDVTVDVSPAVSTSTTNQADAGIDTGTAGDNSVVTDAEYAESQAIFRKMSKDEQERRQKIAQEQIMRALGQ